MLDKPYLLKLAIKLYKLLEEETRQLTLLLNYYQNPPKRFEDDYDIRWAKEIK